MLSCAQRRVAPTRAAQRATQGRVSVLQVRAQRTSSDPSPEILSAFFYGRALAITLNRRLGEAVIDFVSEVSKSLAERPQRIAEFQEEVQSLASKEMSRSGFLPERTSSGSGSSGSGSAGKPGGATGNAGVTLQDPQAAIDDLRAEIAYARASLNEIRAARQAGAAAGTGAVAGVAAGAGAGSQS
ncbi:hypothetical protein CHLRE_01g032750v5 [Chlamydomonas reinhardtii]|uniref:Uncharacterized protein n=1 Tax=Chlamydomonas reinhardtii TaxID=3055 RepID=A8HQP3_CHLRE|nr:uncharacterized protein CHLRE_01g032750v5 [Chlamydomonas reinhardtii]PNW88512.1 hypothetical protein CHLRE_01g032750v5 [Chlamydomonas reinhardtii]|eukprot:XP_001690071.1 hypothetical protein CHLREDRAFT_157319 [Chlamydomonas reinhardtii]